ncbi:precorrin-3B synthase [Novosphingobium terrae]|uniref:precorrin-3B synthase n=1 Tax=Novosphingobium terrae TaxID=2726189 RepID=UPI00198109F2|nr:precorrin-3B synthase [Novosphingobium terrae]
MSAPLIKGWCPGALRPMESGDGLVVRVRAHGGRLSREQARGLADLAIRHGNGLIDLSARANLQLRGICDHAAVVAELTMLGLIDADQASEARRNILVTPFWQAGDGTQTLAQELAETLAHGDLPLPGKFGFALDTGKSPVLREASADIRIERAGDAYHVLADGASQVASATQSNVIATALDLARWFIETGGAANGRGRMRAHLAEAVPLPAGFAQPAARVPAFAPAPGITPAGHMVALEFGQIHAEALAALADLAPLRLTPWRMLLLEGCDHAPVLPGLITAPNDPLLRVVACTGAPGCSQALGPVRDLARQLAPSVPSGGMLHVSGCSKGCAHPGTAKITMVARGEDFVLGYNCQARDANHSIHTPAQLLADPTLLTIRT